MTAIKRVFFVLAIAAFLFGHIGRVLWPGELLGRINPLDLVVVAMVVYAAIRHIRPVRNYWLIGFGAIVVLSVVWGGLLFHIFTQTESILYAVRLALYAQCIAVAPGLWRNDGWLLAQWIGVAVSVAGFIQLQIFPAIPVSYIARFGFDPHNGRLFAVFFDPNLVAGILLITTIVTLGRVLRDARFGTVAALLVQLMAIFATVSRSGLLGLVVAVICVLAALRPRWLLVAVAGGMLAVFLSNSLWNRIVGGIAVDATSQARFASWETAEGVIVQNPVTGIGYNYYQSATTAIGRFSPRIGQITLAANASDSSLLTLWATTGIFGVLLGIGWLLSVTVSDTDKIVSAVTRGVVAGVLVNSLFINTLLYPFVLFLLAITFAARHEDV